MMYRTLPLVLAVVAFLVFLSPAVAADKTHEGKIVKAGNGELTMTDKDGSNKHTHKIPLTATITCDGKDCKLEDLKEGFFVKVTTGQDETTVVRVEALTKEKRD
jgi:hypothetical protein